MEEGGGREREEEAIDGQKIPLGDAPWGGSLVSYIFRKFFYPAKIVWYIVCLS